MRLLILRNQLLKCPELIAQKPRIHQQHVWTLLSNRFGQKLGTFAFGKNVNIALISHGTSHSDQRERLIVRKYNINIGHKIYSPLRNSGSHYRPKSCIKSKRIPKG